MPENGTLDAASRELVLPPAALRRLARMHARIEGAQLLLNAAAQSLQQMQALLREALTEACEEQGVAIPEGGSAPVDIDWRTGAVRVGPPDQQAPLGLPMPAGPGGPPSF